MELRMTRLAALAFLTVVFVAAATDHASAQTIYRWRDARGGLHFSNQVARTPSHAATAELAPLGSISGPAQPRRAPRATGRRGAPAPITPCGPADPTGLAHAIALGVEPAARDEGLTLIVGGFPIAASRDATLRTLLTPWDPDSPHAPLSQSAIAYPSGSSCPSMPPLVRYATTPSRQVRSRGLCDDYRRAFAQVGVATSRDVGVARSFRDIARDFVRVAHEGNVAVASGFRVELARGMFTSDANELAPYMSVPLDAWIVDAHVAQAARLASESDDLVEQLTVALEEIDRAARASGCWN
jgi:hypothetical protein